MPSNYSFPAGIYFFKVNNGNSRTICDICSKFKRKGSRTRLFTIFRSSRSEVFLERGVLIICSKFTGEHPCQRVEITLWHGCSPVNLLDIFRTPFTKNTSGWLLLYFRKLTSPKMFDRVIDVVLASLLLALNNFHILFWCFSS